MFRIRPLKNYFLCFFLFGLNSYIPFRPQKSRAKFILLLPRIVCVFFIISTAFKCFQFLRRFYSTTPNVHIAYMSILLGNTVSVAESVIHSALIKNILQSLNRTIDHLELVMNISVKIRNLAKNYRLKLIVVAVVNIIAISCRIEIIMNVNQVDILISIGSVLLVLTSLHAILVLDLVGLLLFSINDHLNSIASETSSSFPMDPNKIIRILRNVKTVHFKLWEISRSIERRFGWFMLVYTLDLGVLVIGFVFGIYVLVSTSGVSMIIIRKHSIPFIIKMNIFFPH